jgi:hypothetical protein
MSGNAFVSSDSLAIGRYGPGLIWRGDHAGELVAALTATGARELNWMCPIRGQLPDLGCLREVPLQGLRLLPGRALGQSDLDVVQSLRGLRYLSLGHDQVRGKLDVMSMPDLEALVVPWWSGLTGLSSHSLSRLWIRLAAKVDLWSLPTSLAVLQVVPTRSDNLRWVSRLTQLECLSLQRAHALTTLDGVQELPLKEFLVTGGRRLAGIDSLGNCGSLARVCIEDCPAIESLPLGLFKNATHVWLVGSTKVQDGLVSRSFEGGQVRWEVENSRSYDLVRNATNGIPVWEEIHRPLTHPFRPPVARLFRDIDGDRYGKHLAIPAWFRERYPELGGAG